MAIVIRHNGGNWPVDPRVPAPVQGTPVGRIEISDIIDKRRGERYVLSTNNDLSWNPSEVKALRNKPEVMKSLTDDEGQLRKFTQVGVMTWVKDPVQLVAVAGIQTVIHNLGRDPQVSLFDSILGQVIPVAVVHTVPGQQFTVNVGPGPFTGYILYEDKLTN